jgi:hypothetical protein
MGFIGKRKYFKYKYLTLRQPITYFAIIISGGALKKSHIEAKEWE